MWCEIIYVFFVNNHTNSHPHPPAPNHKYRQISNMIRTKSQNLNDSHLVLQLPSHNSLEPGAKSRMKM